MTPKPDNTPETPVIHAEWCKSKLFGGGPCNCQPPLAAPVVRRGWRHFHCGECDVRWKWPTRDVLSPSGENCPSCHVWCFPCHYDVDATIPCDSRGNLTVPWNWDGPVPNEKGQS